MHRLRRQHEWSWGAPVAAEILESRALLSSATAAVHQAQAHQVAALHDTVASPHTVRLPTLAKVTVNANPERDFTGQFTSVKATTTPGGKVTFKFQAKFNDPHVSQLVKASFTGIVTNAVTVVVLTTVTVAPTGGTLLVTQKIKVPGQHLQKAVGTLAPEAFTFTEINGSLAEVKGNFNLSPNNAPPANTGSVAVDLLVLP